MTAATASKIATHVLQGKDKRWHVSYEVPDETGCWHVEVHCRWSRKATAERDAERILKLIKRGAA